MRQGENGADWWAAELDVLPYAVVVDFVFSDAALRAWDNNGQQVREPLLGFRWCECCSSIEGWC